MRGKLTTYTAKTKRKVGRILRLILLTFFALGAWKSTMVIFMAILKHVVGVGDDSIAYLAVAVVDVLMVWFLVRSLSKRWGLLS